MRRASYEKVGRYYPKVTEKHIRFFFTTCAKCKFDYKKEIMWAVEYCYWHKSYSENPVFYCKHCYPTIRDMIKAAKVIQVEHYDDNRKEHEVHRRFFK